MACGWEKSASISIEELQKNQQTVKEVTKNIEVYTDSVSNTNSKLIKLRAHQQTLHQKSVTINKKKDSVSTLLRQVEKSTAQIIIKKIAPTIDHIKTELIALSAPKENIISKLALQEQEVLLADKKITLFTEEKTVYDAQLKALKNKGAAPEDFITINKTLKEIQKHLKEQTLKAANLKNSIANLKEQMIVIDEQIDSLSYKINANYSAKEIVNNYIKEEQDRLFNELNAINLDLESTSSKNDSIQHKIDFYTSNNSNFEEKISNEEKLKTLGNKVQNNAITGTTLKTVDKEKMKNSAFIFIVVIAAILVVFYLISKKRKSKKKLKFLAKL